jgi:hypothetical protein
MEHGIAMISLLQLPPDQRLCLNMFDEKMEGDDV